MPTESTPTEAARLALRKRVANDFVYHAPKGDQVERYARLRAGGKELAEQLIEECSPSRELSLALTSLEEVVMWANASIARNE